MFNSKPIAIKYFSTFDKFSRTLHLIRVFFFRLFRVFYAPNLFVRIFFSASLNRADDVLKNISSSETLSKVIAKRNAAEICRELKIIFDV